MTLADPAVFYDSAQPQTAVAGGARTLWRYRGLLRLLVARDVTVRYKRSFIGVGWSVLNPVATALTMWIVFSQVFRFQIPGVPFIVYVLSGVVMVTFFTQGVLLGGNAVVSNASVLTKVYVPPEIFSLSAVLAAATTLVITLVPLLVLQLATGVGIPITVLLVPIPMVALVAFVTGVSLLVAAAAAAFHDVLELTAVVLQLFVYLTPAFYPVSIVPDRYEWLVKSNPLYSYLAVFRSVLYEGHLAPWWNWVVVAGTSVSLLSLGLLAFTKTWRRLVVQL